MMKRFLLITACFIAMMIAWTPRAQASQPVVQAVLFISPTCPHCQKVMSQDLPPLQTKYGIPGLINAADPTEAPVTPLVAPNASQPRFIQRFLLDPLANSIAVIVLIGMIGSIIALAYRFINPPEEIDDNPKGKETTSDWRRWAVPVLCLLGLGVAGYLTYVEVSHTTALCGPVGNCNSVQTSKYATLWGFMPVGVFGMIGYVAIAIAWIVQLLSTDDFKHYLSLVMWGMALLGVLFSIYLTFLEPFVIGATCAWCISSAIIITLLLWTTTRPATLASSALSGDDE